MIPFDGSSPRANKRLSKLKADGRLFPLYDEERMDSAQEVSRRWPDDNPLRNGAAFAGAHRAAKIRMEPVQDFRIDLRH